MSDQWEHRERESIQHKQINKQEREREREREESRKEQASRMESVSTNAEKALGAMREPYP